MIVLGVQSSSVRDGLAGQVLLQAVQIQTDILMRSHPVNVPNPNPRSSVSQGKLNPKTTNQLATTPFFSVPEKKRMTLLAYITLEECKELNPLEVPLPIGNSPNVAIHFSTFQRVHIKVGSAVHIKEVKKGSRKTSKLGQIIGYDKGVA